MVKEPILTNTRINTPKGALKVFQNIDLERIHSLSLKTKIVFSLGKKVGVYRAKFEGQVYFEDLELTFPFPSYHKSSNQKFETGRFPTSVLEEMPHLLEFSLTAKKHREYEGLASFRDILPNLMDQGYSFRNPDYESIFCLNLGKRKFSGEPILIVSIHGLEIKTSEVNGIKVFTQKDLDNFENLS